MNLNLEPANPMRTPLSTVLFSEVLVVGLAIPVMIMVAHVSAPVAGVAGGVVALLALVAAGRLRKDHYLLGWITQIGVLLLGFLTYGMIIMGVMFAALWVISFVLGRRLDQRRAGQGTAH
ncbi:DUF4233 domain-containing protein [Granulicoccus phenolivorans]|uniref:DUF4233 domain-containing protein n=1 Tax=Granulicoccus phenolivorans TaxID=266854 RepID=UPI000421367C|nr:DUF4233 domain-containing protein [Granulicoccus phenolivorans]